MYWRTTGCVGGRGCLLLGLALAAAGVPGQQPLLVGTQHRAGEMVREIDDPHSGQRWLLVRDQAHPAGPGLLLLAGGGAAAPDRVAPSPRGSGPGPAGRSAASNPSGAPPDPPVIHSGERVILEESTPTVEVRLEAIALNPAWPGSTFNARLSIGGRVVRAVAAGPGSARFAPLSVVEVSAAVEEAAR